MMKLNFTTFGVFVTRSEINASDLEVSFIDPKELETPDFNREIFEQCGLQSAFESILEISKKEPLDSILIYKIREELRRRIKQTALDKGFVDYIKYLEYMYDKHGGK